MSSTRQTLTSCRVGLVAIVILGLTACSNGGSSGPTPASSALQISGSVGDGPVANASLTFEDADGVIIGTGSSDASAKYSIEIPAGTLLPVVVRANGGIDMVSGRELDFELVAVANVDEDSTVNLSPQSTLTVATARCLDNDLSATALRQIWNRTRDQIGLGLSSELLEDPMTQVISAENAANVVLATEALSEIIRRTVDSLNQNSDTQIDGNSVIAELGCDLAFGAKIDGFAADGVFRSGAVYRASEAAVMLEVMAGDLKVGGASASALMDQAVSNIIPPGASVRSVREIPVEEALISQALESLLLVQAVDSSDAALLEVVDILVDTPPSDVRNLVRERVGENEQNALVDLGLILAGSEGREARELVETSRGQINRKAPFISMTADSLSVAQGRSTRLSWASSSADRCIASGSDDWDGPVALSGRFFTADLEHTTQFELRCYGVGGTNTASIIVLVTNDTGDAIEDPRDLVSDGGTNSGGEGTESGGSGPLPAPSADILPVQNDVNVSLRSSSFVVPEGEFVTLNWSSTNADTCEAHRGWSGAQSTEGSLEVGPILDDTTFSLRCRGPEGSTEAMVTVNLQKPLVVAWQAPVENVDGTPIEGLSGYRIFYGETSGNYSDEATINDPNKTEVELNLAAGSYYIAMTAVSLDGTQSPLSNEIVIESR